VTGLALSRTLLEAHDTHLVDFVAGTVDFVASPKNTGVVDFVDRTGDFVAGDKMHRRQNGPCRRQNPPS